MKRLFLVISLALAAFTLLPSQEAIVQSVSGKVKVALKADQWTDVKKGDVLPFTAKVDVGINSKLVLKVGDRLVTVATLKKDTIANIVKATGAGIKTDALAKDGKVNADGASGTKNVSTASTRAEESGGKDLDWADDAGVTASPTPLPAVVPDATAKP